MSNKKCPLASGVEERHHSVFVCQLHQLVEERRRVMTEKSLDRQLEKIQRQKPSEPTQKQIETFVGKTKKINRKETNMKSINWKQILETAKTIVIVALIAGGIGVVIGINYQKSQHKLINDDVKEVVRSLKG
jgi:hypothetical protein|nr:MAG TPA: glycophorin A membrane protein [Caudoviricetes sp.]